MLTLAEWVLFALTGRILVYVWFMFPLPPAFHLKQTYFHKSVKKLHECDLCAGTWIYSVLAFATSADMSGMQTAITIIATGVLTAFAVHVFMIGVKEKFLPPTII